LRVSKDFGMYTVSIDDTDKIVSVDMPYVSRVPPNTKLLDSSEELSKPVNLVYDKDTSTISIGAYSQVVTGGVTDGKIMIANRNPGNDDMSVELWNGKTVTTIPLKISEVVK